jgi:hypothetical protein
VTVGRDAEAAALVETHASPGLTVVADPPGIGKITLVLEVAACAGTAAAGEPAGA